MSMVSEPPGGGTYNPDRRRKTPEPGVLRAWLRSRTIREAPAFAPRRSRMLEHATVLEHPGVHLALGVRPVAASQALLHERREPGAQLVVVRAQPRTILGREQIGVVEPEELLARVAQHRSGGAVRVDETAA